MSDLVPNATAPAAYAAPKSRAELNVECLERVLSGRPLPEGLAAHIAAAPLPRTNQEGIERILRGM